MRSIPAGIVAVLVCAALTHAQGGAERIQSSDLLAGSKPGRWITFSGDYTGQRHSPLSQITPANVGDLKEQWAFDSRLPVAGRGTEATPLFFDGRLYVTGQAGHAWAIGCTNRSSPCGHTGANTPSGMLNCCGAINRGFGVLGDMLYMGTVDARLVALNVNDGTVIWESPIADGSKGYSMTMAPLVVKDKVIVGVSGSEFPTRGFIDAYNAQNRQPRVAFLHRAGAGRARQRNVADG